MDPERVVIDTERVIAEVRARPQIWDPANDYYKSRDARLAAWSDVSRSIVGELQELDRFDQREIEKKIQQRWRTARDCFVKARAQLLAGGCGTGKGDKSYGYYDAMTFLEPTLRLPLKVQKTLATTPLVLPVPLAPNSPSLPAIRKRGARRGPKGLARKRARVAERGSGEPTPESPPPHASGAVAAELSPFERKVVALLQSYESPLDEDDDNFFKSLGPMLRTFDTQQKLEFRSRVLALALETRRAGAGAESAGLRFAEVHVGVGEDAGSPRSEPDVDALEHKYQLDSDDEPLETKYCPPDLINHDQS